jgi:hypothetical protein
MRMTRNAYIAGSARGKEGWAGAKYDEGAIGVALFQSSFHNPTTRQNENLPIAKAKQAPF